MRTVHADDECALAAAAASLQAGEVVIIPTDTVYGLAAMPERADAVHRIYLAKGRPPQMHLPVLAATHDQVSALGVEFSAAATQLASAWWPGPLTMAFGFSPTAPRPSWLTHRDEVAVRIPQNEFLLALLAITGVLVVTSANRHGEATPASAKEAGSRLTPYVNLVVDAGILDVAPSTVVNVHVQPVAVEREGAIAASDIETALKGTV